MNTPRLKYTSHRPVRSVPDMNRFDVDPSQVVYAKDIRMGLFNPGQGVATRYKIAGNLEVYNGFLPAGDNIPVGACTNDTKTAFFIAWYNSFGQHSITRYSDTTGVQVVIQDPILGFRQRNFPSFPGYIDAREYVVSMDINGDILVWTDNIIEPRTAYVEKMIAGELNVPLSNWILSQRRRAPRFAPWFYVQTPGSEYDPSYIALDAEKQPSDFANVGVQFTTSYTLWDNSETRIGPWSQMWFNNKVIVYVNPDEVRDCLLSSTDPIIPSTFVKAVNVYYRRGNDGDVLLLKRIDNVQANYSTINTMRTMLVGIDDLRYISGSTVTPADLLSYSDAVPLLARKNMFSGSRLHWLNYQDNRDPIPFSISVQTQSVLISQYQYGKYRTALAETEYEFGVAAFDAYGGGTTILSKTPFKTGAVSELKFITDAQATSTDLFDSAFVGDADIDTKNARWYDLSARVSGILPDWVDNLRFFARRKVRKQLQFKGIARVVMVYSKLNLTTGVKTFYYSPFVPQDSNPGSLTQSSFEGIGFIPDENIPINYSSETPYTIRIRRHFTYKPNQTPTDRVNAFEDMEKEFTVSDFRDGIFICKIKDADLAKFYIVNLFNDGTSTNSFLWYGGAVTGSSPLLRNRFYQSFSEVEISINGTGAETFFQIGEAIPAAQYAGVVNPVVPLLWEGDVFMTRVAGQTGLAPYPSISDIRVVVDSIKYEYWVASMNLCGPFIERWPADFGQPNVFSAASQKKQIKPNYTRHSEQFIQGSNINGLFTVQESNETFMPLELGAITEAFPGSVDANTGNRIRVICESGCVSLYLDRTVLQNQDGSANLIQSTLVYGTKNPMRDLWGATLMQHCTVTPEGLVFFLSEPNKTLIQFSENGLANIPRQAQDRFASAIQNIDFSVAKVGVDPYFKEILISLGAGGLAYNYEQNAFQHERTYGLDARASIWIAMGARTYMVHGDKIYEFNRTAPDGINRLFGFPFAAVFTVVSNGDPKLGKVFKAIRMKSDVPWDARVFTDNTRIIDGQVVPRESTTSANQYQKVEGLWVGSIYQDINSNGGKFSGLDMKGYLAEVEFTTSDPKETTFEFVEIGYHESNIQKR